ncbi:MAG: YceD family protein [Ruminococcus sp.]
MIFDLKEVFEGEGVSKSLDFKLDLRDIAVDGVHPFSSEACVTATACNKTGIVSLSIKAEFVYSRPCDRCMKPLSETMTYTFSHRLVQSLYGDDDDDYIETPDYRLELEDLVTSDILLELPLKFLCSDGCKGLCPKCGQDLNEGNCSCGKRTVDPRLEVLRQLID